MKIRVILKNGKIVNRKVDHISEMTNGTNAETKSGKSYSVSYRDEIGPVWEADE